MKLKTVTTPMRLKNSFLIYLTQFTIFPKGFCKIKDKANSESLDNKRECQIF